MITIWKFPIENVNRQVLRVPKGIKPLTVEVQNGVPCLWATVDTEAELGQAVVRVVGTGHDAEEVRFMDYLGTYQLRGGALVFHVFGDLP